MEWVPLACCQRRGGGGRLLCPEPDSGSSRHIEASLAAGASGVVATPLAVLPEPFPGRSTEKVQAAVKRLYPQVDRAASREDRMNLLTSLFRHAT